MRDDGPAEGHFIEERAIIETMRIGLTSANMPIPEMHGDGWQSLYLTMAIYTKLCGILPYLIYLLSMTMIIYETSNWMPRYRYTYRRHCRTEYNTDYYSRDQIKCRMAEITMPNTMPSTIPNTMPNLFRSYIIENTIPKDVSTQNGQSRATQLRWQLMTTNRLRNQQRIKPFQCIFPTKQNEISRRRSNDL